MELGYRKPQKTKTPDIVSLGYDEFRVKLTEIQDGTNHKESTGKFLALTAFRAVRAGTLTLEQYNKLVDEFTTKQKESDPIPRKDTRLRIRYSGGPDAKQLAAGEGVIRRDE